ncbi:PTS sugar transporter subunit IIC/EAL domain-containing protein [Desulforamulus ruminis]|uniref:PTS system, lactose/cellobiose family IIC subunit n=1 Tax=Desulforamulus ruminis (strain ATCC 23193 / DSM 2154 / NCIMB 8452 / DL) TaxID=696281 RepID=F6DRU0_DESRL|nr:EAL domain-containing protein [Desulforamulus ruminis]AEG59851.1 PTS system, lactose/cellobiose family IIC subunit [Desulforamulus ruminis DSM 2154]
MIEKFEALVSKLANQQTLRALRKGLLYLMPFILIGSIVLALLNLPIPAYQNFLLCVFGEGWREIGHLIHRGTLQIMAITALITVSYAISMEKRLVKSGEVNAIIIVITAFASFIAFINDSNMIISAEEAGSAGMFGAIVISVLSCELFCFFYKCRDCIQPSDLINYNGSALIRASFRAVIPALLTVSIFSVTKMLLDFIGLTGSQAMLLQAINEIWMTGQNYSSALIIIVITHILWFFGIHGGNVIMDALSDATPVISSATDASILTKEFLDTYVYLGGAGATLGLLVALLLIGKKSSENRLAKISILPGIFNINEIMIFGLPIIFNAYFFIPFVLSPVILSFTAWTSVRMGWVPPVTQAVEWTTPIFLSGYLGTGSVDGIVMQAVNLALAVLVYIPFVRLQERRQQRVRITVFKNLGSEIQQIQEQQKKTVLNRHDEIGSLARALVSEIKDGFRNRTQTLHLEYQPKVNHKGEVMGAEALLRWIHPIYGYVSPLVILRICDEANLTNELGIWVMNQAFGDLKRWQKQGYKVSLSVNLSPRQLQEDESLVQTVQSHVNRLGIEPRYMELELVENAAIDSSDSTRSKLEKIKGMGINLSIDDFGMGHSSLLYICDFYANIVKIDAALVRAVTSDKQRQQIVKSILSLCSQLNVKAVAEGVETKEQVQLLHELGCEYYQGFYFSRSLSIDSFLEYVKQHGVVDQSC